MTMTPVSQSVVRYRVDDLAQQRRRARRRAVRSGLFTLLVLGFFGSVYLYGDLPGWVLAIVMFNVLFGLVSAVYPAVSPRHGVPESEVAMIFDADGATFHPLGRPRVRLGWGEFSMEVRWHESITVRHGRTKRRFLVAYLDTTTPRIVALANRASMDAATIVKK